MIVVALFYALGTSAVLVGFALSATARPHEAQQLTNGWEHRNPDAVEPLGGVFAFSARATVHYYDYDGVAIVKDAYPDSHSSYPRCG
jgi:hypothetical protein